MSLSPSTLTAARDRIDALLSGARPTKEERLALRKFVAQPRKPTEREKAAKGVKAGKREARSERMAQIREAVMERAGNVCECCVQASAVEAHHVASGSGNRRVYEDTTTVIALCRECHRAAHRGDRETLGSIGGWAELQGYTLAAKTIDRRLARAAQKGMP